jgi:hypothetical protein
MLRNLLYSLFFNLMMFVILVISIANIESINLRQPKKYNLNPTVVDFIDEKILEEVRENTTKNPNEKVKNLAIDDKVDLYKKIKNNENTLQIYENNETIANEIVSDNEFSYHFTPIYVAEAKLTEIEKQILINDHLKKEEMRKKIREKGIVSRSDLKFIKPPNSIKIAVEIAKKQIVAPKENKNVSNDIKIIAANNSEENEVANDKDLKKEEIFTIDDYKKLKEINENENQKFNLSIRERGNIQQQIKNCYKTAILRSKKDSKSIVSLTVDIERNGLIDLNKVVIENNEPDNKSYQIALENAKTALVFCTPLKGLPIPKYNIWKRLTLIFDSSDL